MNIENSASLDKTKLIQDLDYELVRWKSMHGIETATDARRFVKEQLVYSLRMIWQGRFDKYSKEHCEIIDRLAHAYLPPECNYVGAKRSTQVLEGQDHDQLAMLVFDRVWNDYMADDSHGLERPPVEQKPLPLLKRFLTLFKRG